MLRKISIVVAIFAALGLAIATPTDAKQNNKNNKQGKKNVQVNKTVKVNKTVQVNKNVSVKYVVGKKYNGNVWYGHHRHRWHGVWYDYGVGPCWINVDGLWFWNVAACP